ncbi:DNA repair protein complementing XP-A cells homolog [Oppia nitens]|uniref:DNA repair protein complementing XP-A cells homolog n=1 Tax=Oppia nitens TaxID=1686743 RepID=UPI0023DC5AAB|nr:DNA repair protein complementing XP-A cells homolog [Oppia nitens]
MSELTDQQKADIERKRQNALLLRQQKSQKLSTNELYSQSVRDKQSTAGLDSGGGFLIDSDSDEDTICPAKTSNNDQNDDMNETIQCIDCHQDFNKSFLMKHFSLKTCDLCRDLKDKHSLITRTEAKSEYLLKDCDLDKREPSLRFIAKKNPHEFAKGDMKLYLRSQIEDRALQVWGNEDNLMDEREKRLEMNKRRKEKQYEKKIKTLRMTVRSSLYTKQSDNHCHDFDDEVYNEEQECYEKTCKSCGYIDSYEKM